MAPHLAPTSELALGVVPTTGITLSDEDVRENARSAAVLYWNLPFPIGLLEARIIE
jgi:hypothetical protein